ncbi:DUF3140 domain-containing protein [Nocardioides aestuarii]|uniref:DUF3140 domain-containing protein n=1 Tax=Nocardioides aestuarii TaxID=252231 RepID=A0ABW4TTY2_9ACTN
MADSIVTDELWQEFHDAVNMSSRELADWLRERGAGIDTEEVPDRAGPAVGRQVLDILGRRRVDVTRADAIVMAGVVQRVHDQRGADAVPRAGDAAWRHSLMDFGHDPLRD